MGSKLRLQKVNGPQLLEGGERFEGLVPDRCSLQQKRLQFGEMFQVGQTVHCDPGADRLNVSSSANPRTCRSPSSVICEFLSSRVASRVNHCSEARPSFPPFQPVPNVTTRPPSRTCAPSSSSSAGSVALGDAFHSRARRKRFRSVCLPVADKCLPGTERQIGIGRMHVLKEDGRGAIGYFRVAISCGRSQRRDQSAPREDCQSGLFSYIESVMAQQSDQSIR